MTSFYLRGLCGQYAGIIHRIERTSNAIELQALEDERDRLHNLIIDAMHGEGLQFSDRFEVTDTAIDIAMGRL